MRATASCLLLFIFLLLSCKRDKTISELPQPLKTFIANSKDCTCEPFIDKYLWRNQTVYLSSCGGPTCDCITLYYNEQGEKMNMDSGYYPDQFRQEAQLVKHVWRCRPF